MLSSLLSASCWPSLAWARSVNDIYKCHQRDSNNAGNVKIMFVLSEIFFCLATQNSSATKSRNLNLANANVTCNISSRNKPQRRFCWRCFHDRTSVKTRLITEITSAQFWQFFWPLLALHNGQHISVLQQQKQNYKNLKFSKLREMKMVAAT